MTFEQFRATGREVADLNVVLGTSDLGAGRVYAQETDYPVYIEKDTRPDAPTPYFLTISSQGWSESLAALERRLYDFWRSEVECNSTSSSVTSDDVRATLCSVLQQFARSQRLDLQSADDMLADLPYPGEGETDDPRSVAQRAWLDAYITLWDKTGDLP
jgi:hypothetical protein